MERQKVEARVKAKHAEAAEQFRREEEEEEELSNGNSQEEDNSTEAPMGSSQEADESTERAAAGGSASLRAKRNSFVRRGVNKFVSASKVELIDGEKLY